MLLRSIVPRIQKLERAPYTAKYKLETETIKCADISYTQLKISKDYKSDSSSSYCEVHR